VLYRLPYLEGEAYAVSQAPGGFIGTHTTRATRRAVDFRMPEGTPVAAARGGVVIEAEWRIEGRGADGMGNVVRVRHADGTIGVYAHLEFAGVSVEAGEEIQAGRIVGYSGATGFASAPHLHFAVLRGEESLPVRFYNGVPPEAFAPRVGMAIAARYAGPLEPLPAPRAAPPAPRRAEAPPASPEAIAQGSLRLAAWILLGIAGLWWFYRFWRS
jgi:murein DD-endopeptidase MepM/ murein hydrolase activator NlpD